MEISRRLFIRDVGRLATGAALLGRGGGAFAGEGPPRRPNIVLLFMDDMGWAEPGCFGNTFNETPNIDSLAEKGMRFTSAYAAAPVCSPTRASIMTGQYPARVGINDYLRADDPNHLSPSHYTVAEAVKAAGYRTCLIGKWHLMGDYRTRKGDPKLHGFDEVICSEQRYIGGGFYFPPFKHLPQVKPRSPKEFLTDRLYHEAVGFIERNKDRPFFLFVSNYSVHTRLNAPAELVEKYKRKPGAGTNKNNPTLAAMIERIDAGIGSVLAKLDELKLSDNTIVVFMSDNGGEGRVTTNGPLRGAKSQTYEGGIREPLIVRWPGVVKPGGTSDTPVCTIDFYPTFVEMAGGRLDPKQHLDGVSFVPLLNGAGTLGRDALYWHYPLKKPHFLGGRSSGAVRKGDLKLIEFFETGDVEMYNLKDDIGERNDLSKEQPEKAAELRKLLADWRKSVGAVVPTAPKPARGVQLHLKFDEAPGAKRCADASPHKRKLDIHGTKLVAGRKGNARRFDGVADHLSLPRANAPEVGGVPITVSAWIKPGKPDGVILAHGGERLGYSLHVSGGRLAMSVAVDRQRATVTAKSKLPDGWVHVAGKLEREGVVKLFVNGKPAGRGKARGLLSGTPGDSIEVGADTISLVADYGANNHFAGLIDEVTLFLGERPDDAIAREAAE